MLRAILFFAFLVTCSATQLHSSGRGFARAPVNDPRLRTQIQKLIVALNKRDLDSVRSQISPSRVFVEITTKPGAYLSNSQTILVMESFIRTRTGISSVFDFVSDDGRFGSASGTMTATEGGRRVSYRLDFGFVLSGGGSWLLSRISIR